MSFGLIGILPVSVQEIGIIARATASVAVILILVTVRLPVSTRCCCRVGYRGLSDGRRRGRCARVRGAGRVGRAARSESAAKNGHRYQDANFFHSIEVILCACPAPDLNAGAPTTRASEKHS